MEHKINFENAEAVNIARERDVVEQVAVGATNAETLKSLGIPLNTFPQKCRTLLQKAAEYQLSMEIPTLDPILFTLQQTQSTLRQIDADYEILQLKQKEKELEYSITHNKHDIAAWRDELVTAKNDLNKQDPSPESIHEEICIVKQKIASYEQSCEKTKMRFSNLRVPTELYPAPLETLIVKYEQLKEEEANLQVKAEHILLAQVARQNILQIKANRS